MKATTPGRSAGRAPYHQFRLFGRVSGLTGALLLLLAGCAGDATRWQDVTWQWQHTLRAGQVVLAPRPGHVYTLRFAADGRLSGQVDCNRLGGRYRLSGDRFALEELISTRAWCGESSRDQAWMADLEAVTRLQQERGRLRLETPDRTMWFRRQK